MTAEWSVSVVDLGTGQVLAAHDPDQLLSTASIAKVFVLIELAERLRDNEITLDESLDRRAVPPVADSGLWHHMQTEVMPLADVATLVGAVSDNWATNVLIDLLGLQAIRARAREWAPGGSDLVDIVRGLRGPDDPPHLSLGCASDWTTVLARLWSERDIAGSVGHRVLTWLAPGVDLSMVANAFGQDPLAHAEDPLAPTVLNKTGTNLGVRGDIGIADWGHRAIAWAAIANWPEDPPGRGRVEVLATLRAIGSEIRTLGERP